MQDLAAFLRDRISDRWCRLRDRLLTSPDFRRRAAAFRLTRPTARRQANAVFDLVAGFVYSQVLVACVQLRLFEILADGPKDLHTLALRLELNRDAAQRLLAAAVSLRLVERRSSGRYGLGPLGSPLVNNTAVTAMIEHHRALYADLADPVALLRGQAAPGALARYWPYAAERQSAGLSGQQVAAYTELMAASQPLVADEILDTYDLARHKRLLDVGGGDGSFLVAAARRAPALQLVVFDLPAVAERARRRFEDAGLTGRASAIGGNFLADELPAGADVASLVRVIHDHDDAGAITILRAVRRALAPEGRLLLAEPMAATPGAEAMGDAYFGFYLLAMGRGQPRTPEALTVLLKRAGFAHVRVVPTRMPLQTGLLVASGVAR